MPLPQITLTVEKLQIPLDRSGRQNGVNAYVSMNRTRRVMEQVSS
jgi:hypothetical protein